MNTKKTFRSVMTTLAMSLVLPVLTGCPQSSEEPAAEATKNVVPGRILVQYRQNVKGTKAKGILAAAGGKEVDAISTLGVSVVELPGDQDGQEQVNALSACPEVEFAELDPVAAPDFVVNDTSLSKEWHLTKIAAPTAWDSTLGSSSVIIAILDTGVYSGHADLADKIVAGWNTYDNNSDTSDVYGHGTAVAGCAAASTNNGIGIAGVAANCKIMPMRISDTAGLGYGSTIAAALTWAADHGARVANVSFRMDYSATVKAAAQYFMSKGGVVTMSAGNENTYYASATDNPYVLTVGATTSADALASYTNTGGNIDVVAPGNSIYTTTRAGSYSSWSGTSFSAPITAGVAALVISAKPTLTGDEVQSILKNSADDLGATGYDTGFGWGRINAAKAVALAKPATTSTTPTTNTSTSTSTTTSTTTTTDTVLPIISITAPSANANVNGSVSITVNATDNVKMKKVQLMVDGAYVTQSLTAPYTNVWDASTATSGTHTISCRAVDAAGNIGLSQTITVTVGTITTTTTSTTTTTTETTTVDTVAPVISIMSPSANAKVSGTVSITVNVTDNVKVKKVQLMVDGVYVTQNLSAPYTTTWNASAATAGTHTIYCRGIDTAGNVGVSQTITVTK